MYASELRVHPTSVPLRLIGAKPRLFVLTTVIFHQTAKGYWLGREY